mmetsp:Transcript_33017/g.58105  ORF Transcript_33017/g.58105 Transcript_33017/m.58105 type:complete len:420 (+) Transcript_33017:4315-5574(+)
MGQAINCKSCCSDSRADLELRNSIVYVYKSETTDAITQEATEPFRLSKKAIEFSKSDLELAVTKIQALWRAVAVRRQVKRLVRHYIQNHLYFSKDEILETINSNKILASEHSLKPPYRYTSGAVYTGQWLGGFRDGWGVIVYSLGEKYEGYWSFGRPHGQGKFSYEGGQSYKGKWCNPLSKGQTSLCKTGEGWKSTVKDGYEWLWYMEELPKIPDLDEQKRRIVESIKKSEKRVESIKNSIDHLEAFKKGRGRRIVNLKTEDTTYTGETIAGMKDGFGKQEWKNGDFYEGQWKENTQHGWGRNVWDDGSEYTGTFKHDNKDGVGNYKWEDGTNYTGEWHDNMMHGYGKYTWPDGRSFEGEWRSGFMQGFGIYYYADGKRYEGGWYQGKKHGMGTTYSPEGRTSKLIWKSGKVEAIAKGN